MLEVTIKGNRPKDCPNFDNLLFKGEMEKLVRKKFELKPEDKVTIIFND